MVTPTPVVSVAGAEVPCSGIMIPLTITHGRSSVTSQPDAPTLDMTVVGRVPWQRNDPITVTVDGSARFSGFVDTLTTDYVGGEFVTHVSGVGWLAKAGAVRPSIPPRLEEDDVARATAYLSVYRDAFPAHGFQVKGTATVRFVGQDVDGGHTVLALMQDVCDSTGALLWQAKDGTLVYGTASHRTRPSGGAGALLYIDECDIADGVQWVKGGAMLVNRARIAYGPVVDTRTVYEAVDSPSVAAEGPKDVRVDSLLASEADAILLGNLILYRRAKPYWTLPGAVVVYASDMPAADYATLLSLDVSDLVLVRVSRDPQAPENLVEWVIEGWVEQWDAGDDGLAHTMRLSLSDRARFGVSAIRTVGELAAGFTVATAGAMTIRNAMFKEIA
jgi:hypothetical protein